MKYKTLFLMAFSIICFLGTVSFAYLQVESKPKLKLAVSFPKEKYMLGEPISPIFEIKNEANKAITIWDCFNVKSSSIQVWATKESDKPIGFGNSKWGTADSICRTIILPNQTIQSTAGILWSNGKKMEPEFSLTIAGDYYFKVHYTAFLEEGGKSLINLESNPIKITIEEPVGEDLEVWNKIKDNGNFAYFIQEGNMRIPTYQPEQLVKFQAEVEEILRSYPNSFYGQSLRQSLDKFKVNEAKRLEFVEKLKAQQNKP